MPLPIPSEPILIVDDDKKTVALVAAYLERDGFKALAAHDGHEALELAQRHNPAFVILDLMLPGVDGWDVCRALRRTSDVPILILSARQEEQDRVVGLSLGADDFVVKPFGPRELVARVRAILRRARPEPARSPDRLVHGALVLDLTKRTATLKGRRLALTRSEFTLLRALMSCSGRVFERGELLKVLYPTGEVVVDRVIDVHVGKLRQKIGDDPAAPHLILTVRGMGYQFVDAER
jgi:DNA-binding response OmpR family regulator